MIYFLTFDLSAQIEFVTKLLNPKRFVHGNKKQFLESGKNKHPVYLI